MPVDLRTLETRLKSSMRRVLRRDSQKATIALRNSFDSDTQRRFPYELLDEEAQNSPTRVCWGEDVGSEEGGRPSAATTITITTSSSSFSRAKQRSSRSSKRNSSATQNSTNTSTARTSWSSVGSAATAATAEPSPTTLHEYAGASNGLAMWIYIL